LGAFLALFYALLRIQPIRKGGFAEDQ